MRNRREVQGIIFAERNDKRYTLLVKKLDLRSLSFKWRLLKGGIENRESEEEALKREIKEEVGLKNIKILKKIYNYDFNFFGTHHMVSTYLVKADMEEDFAINTKEIIGARWVPFAQAMNLLHFQEEKNALRQVK